mmetsp:Transcript_14855/g.46533  ORF Transcript_14855/g.46533 Transcript_14855/m.46533 type:complete len:457 (-) Transcript_14855:134-1504(-)
MGTGGQGEAAVCHGAAGRTVKRPSVTEMGFPSHSLDPSCCLLAAEREATEDLDEASLVPVQGAGNGPTACAQATKRAASVCSRIYTIKSEPVEQVDPVTAATLRNREAEEDEDVEFDIPEDAYGAATLAIVRDFQDAYRAKDVFLNLATGCFALILNVLNLTLQFSVVCYLQVYVVNPKVYQVQALYRDFRAEVFSDSGEFLHDNWENFDRQQELCQVALTNTGFYVTSLFLWWASMMQEFRTTWRLFLNISNMPSCRKGSQMLRIETPKHDHCTKHLETEVVHIIALTVHARYFLYFLVCLPKFLICTCLLWSGSEWLSSTSAFEDLIMNAVAMTFVTHIDELLFEVLLPAKYRQEVAAINFVVPCRKGTPQTVRETEMWYGFRRSAMYVVFMLLGLTLYSQVLQDVLPHDISDLRKHCAKYIDDIQPICRPGVLEKVAARMAGSSASETCYPYR